MREVLREPALLSGQSVTKEQMLQYGEVKTFCRDSVSETWDDTDSEAASRLSENPRFAQIFDNPSLRYYFSNDTRNRERHQTDSHKKYPHGLPYLAESVWPIRLPSRVVRRCEGDKSNEQRLVGFIIVTCSRKNAFNERIDFEVGAIVADALYTFLNKSHVQYFGGKQQNAQPAHRAAAAARMGRPAAVGGDSQPVVPQDPSPES